MALSVLSLLAFIMGVRVGISGDFSPWTSHGRSLKQIIDALVVPLDLLAAATFVLALITLHVGHTTRASFIFWAIVSIAGFVAGLLVGDIAGDRATWAFRGLLLTHVLQRELGRKLDPVSCATFLRELVSVVYRNADEHTAASLSMALDDLKMDTVWALCSRYCVIREGEPVRIQEQFCPKRPSTLVVERRPWWKRFLAG